MADIWNKRKRSEVMSLIRSKGNDSTELRLIRIFKQQHITGWRRGQKLRGNPDFTFRTERLCVFVDGCFWHGCPRCYRHPESNHDYWAAKVERNRARDKLVSRELRREDWRVLRVWEHELLNNCRASLLRRFEKLFHKEEQEGQGTREQEGQRFTL